MTSKEFNERIDKCKTYDDWIKLYEDMSKYTSEATARGEKHGLNWASIEEVCMMYRAITFKE